jgi:hypothetical protein
MSIKNEAFTFPFHPKKDSFLKKFMIMHKNSFSQISMKRRRNRKSERKISVIL